MLVTFPRDGMPTPADEDRRDYGKRTTESRSQTEHQESRECRETEADHRPSSQANADRTRQTGRRRCTASAHILTFVLATRLGSNSLSTDEPLLTAADARAAKLPRTAAGVDRLRMHAPCATTRFDVYR
jgi:hypothetical protein